MDFNSIEDRALSEHRGSCLMNKKANGKYSIFLPVEGTGENGSTPAQLDKTAIGNRQATSVEGRQENAQKTLPFFYHRDNVRILEDVKGISQDFLRVFPDLTAIKYSGKVSYMANNTDVGSLEQGQITITPESSDEFVNNCYDLIEDTVIYTTSIPEVITLNKTTKTYELTLSTNPTDATITGKAEGEGIVTANVAEKKLTITATAKGSDIVELTATKDGYNSFKRTILVIVEEDVAGE